MIKKIQQQLSLKSIGSMHHTGPEDARILASQLRILIDKVNEIVEVVNNGNG